MIAYTTLLLFFIGIFSGIKVGVKVDKILSFLTFTSLFLVFIGFCDSMYFVNEQVFSFVWNTTPGRSLKFDIVSNSYNYTLALPCFILTVLGALNNLFFRYEERKSSYVSILVLNLAALLILITSNNFVQLLSALFVIDILALFMIKDIDASRRYVMVNMLADMILFTVLAAINSRVASLDINQIVLYRNTGTHQNFVALAGLTAVFIKMGFFLFQVGIMGLKKIRFHRMQNILFLSSPLAALIILLKFSTLWRASAYFTMYLDAVCIATMVWGCIGGLCANNYRAKIIYWQMSFWALFVELLRFHGFIWFSEFTFLLLEMFVITGALYLIYFYNNRRFLMTQIKNIPLINKKAMGYALVFVIVGVAAMANTLTVLYNNINRWYIWGFAVMFLLSLSAVIKQLFSERNARIISENTCAPIKFQMFFELMFLSAFLLQDWRFAEPSVWGSSVVFALLCVFNPLAKMDFIYGIDILQDKDLLGRLYHIVVKSIRLCGRFFWLLIDRLFMEKFVLALFSSGISSGMRLFRKLHSSRYIGGFIVVVMLAYLLWYSYINGGNKL